MYDITNTEKKKTKIPNRLITILFFSKSLFWGKFSRVDSLDLWELVDKPPATVGDEIPKLSKYFLDEPVE